MDPKMAEVVTGDSHARSDDILLIAHSLLERVLDGVNLFDIHAQHGPGAVATGEDAEEKFTFTSRPRFIPELAKHYPYDQFFYWSLSHLSDELLSLITGPDYVPIAQVVIVPKDSRGGRVISEEPLETQWIQQGQRRVLCDAIERHPLTRGNVSFTEQGINQELARAGSDGTFPWATLDLKEASDRISLELVRTVWPEHIVSALIASRSIGTTLPSGEVIMFQKFAPMGSSLCFPVMALTIWSISLASIIYETRLWKRGRFLRNGEYVLDPRLKTHCLQDLVYVYGDDIIVPESYAGTVIGALETYNLKVNVNKSFTAGPFKESCGYDAFLGVKVTPQRFSTPWSSTKTAEHLVSWCAYANACIERGDSSTAEYISDKLQALYGPLPRVRDPFSRGYPTLDCRIAQKIDYNPRRRWNHHLQRWETKVWVIRPERVEVEETGWCGLLRWGTVRNGRDSTVGLTFETRFSRIEGTTASLVENVIRISEGVRSGVYSPPRRSELVREWVEVV